MTQRDRIYAALYARERSRRYSNLCVRIAVFDEWYVEPRGQLRNGAYLPTDAEMEADNLCDSIQRQWRKHGQENSR